MRSATVEVVSGRVATNGAVLSGPLTCRREAQGRYRMYSPEGRRMLGLLGVGVSFPQWAFVQIVDPNDQNCLIIFCNQAATIEVDANFFYTASFAV